METTITKKDLAQPSRDLANTLNPDENNIAKQRSPRTISPLETQHSSLVTKTCGKASVEHRSSTTTIYKQQHTQVHIPCQGRTVVKAQCCNRTPVATKWPSSGDRMFFEGDELTAVTPAMQREQPGLLIYKIPKHLAEPDYAE
jgi:hypothetical protein